MSICLRILDLTHKDNYNHLHFISLLSHPSAINHSLNFNHTHEPVDAVLVSRLALECGVYRLANHNKKHLQQY